jgi:1-acyl-sn-glycerol-3-phosphate acyltransferase
MRETGSPWRERSPTAIFLFSHYLRWYFGRRFHALRVARNGLPMVPPNRPVIVYSNHPSWWDPALFILLSTRLMPGRPGFGPMEADSLEKYRLLRRMGVFGIDPETTAGAATFLRTSLDLLRSGPVTLWVTAEGQFTDARRRPVRLRPGIAHLARLVPEAVILPLAIEYPFWDESRPEALARFGAPVASGERTVGDWGAVLEGALTETMDALSADAATRNPALFVPILRGGAGVGGVYDVWRRLRSWSAGRGFDPSHGGEAKG